MNQAGGADAHPPVVPRKPGELVRGRADQPAPRGAPEAADFVNDPVRVGEGVAVAALNPHGGEGGLFGNEETEVLEPAIALARAEGVEAFGPFPAVRIGGAVDPARLTGSPAQIRTLPPEKVAEMAEDVFGTDDIELKQLMMLVPAYSDTDRPESHDLAEVAEAVSITQQACAVEPLTVPVHDEAHRLAELHTLAWYDALIASAAIAAGCDTLYSEDMHDGLRIGRTLTVRNPFRVGRSGTD